MQGNQQCRTESASRLRPAWDGLHVFGLRNGPTPNIGVELDVILGDRRIRARVTNIDLPVSKMGGTSVDEVYANEI
jgi:hypothetical protein